MGALHGSVNTAEMPDVMCWLETFVTDRVLWQRSLFSCPAQEHKEEK